MSSFLFWKIFLIKKTPFFRKAIRILPGFLMSFFFQIIGTPGKAYCSNHPRKIVNKRPAVAALFKGIDGGTALPLQPKIL